MKIAESEFRNIFEDRAATYGLLARLYNREVDQHLLEELHKLPLPVNTGVAAIDEGNALMGRYLRGKEVASCRELAVDFARLFIIREASTRDAAYPFESVYTSRLHIMMDEARDDIISVYRAAGLVKSKVWKEGEDHISLALEFMQILTNRIVEGLEENNEAVVDNLLEKQQEFLQNHLLNWVPLFVVSMETNSHTDFYRGLALFTKGFLEDDYNFLETFSAKQVTG
ncbi:MAG: molecular chaperone TorD family protein [Raoultibacter sp.]